MSGLSPFLKLNNIPFDGQLVYFHLLSIVNNVATNMSIHISVQDSVLNYFGYILGRGFAGTYGNILKNIFWGIAPF